jgi:predicted MPP superfamily phosphohydrolase
MVEWGRHAGAAFAVGSWMSQFSRRRFLAGTATFAAVGLATREAEAFQLEGVRVERQTFHLPGLHPNHDGMLIAQLSDIHVGPQTGEAAVRTAIKVANSYDPDLVVLTGDYLVHDKKGVGWMRDQLGGLQAPTIAVLGNHDHWVDPVGASNALLHHGYAVLRNQHEWITLRGEPFTVIGIDDLMTRHADPAKAFAGSRPGSRIVLAHVPRTAEQLATFDEAMVCLSGHTHGGQVHVPAITRVLMKAITHEPFERGRYQVGKVQLYVNRGVGLSGFPVRINSPPEMTLITLRAAPAV